MKKAIQICLSAAAFLLLSQPCVAQKIVWNGGTAGFGDTTIRYGMASIPDGALKLDLNGRALSINSPDRDAATVVRVLKLADGRSIVYRLVVKRLENGARFEVLLQAHEPTPEQVQDWGIDPGRVENSFLSKYAQPITINNGDIISLDVLIEPRSKAKLVECFQISTDKLIAVRNADKLKVEARALTLEDLILTVEGYEVRRNGEKLYKSGGGASGRYIWLGIPQVGRAIFTLATPPEGNGFEQTAIVNNNQLIFSIDGAQYEWLSKSRIVTADGSFHVWMKFDPTFSWPSLPPNLPPEVLERIRSGWSVGASDEPPKEKKED
ncbi:MAG: hypothetical protein J2P52_16125 [Blastocatellia bacterium]|nr:hypothetical protein [Blastocatellia bacterium]